MKWMPFLRGSLCHNYLPKSDSYGRCSEHERLPTLCVNYDQNARVDNYAGRSVIINCLSRVDTVDAEKMNVYQLYVKFTTQTLGYMK